MQTPDKGQDFQLIHFPVMHKELLPCPLPAGVAQLDPGLSIPDRGLWRNEGFPLSERQAKQYLDGMLHFGSQFRTPQEMRAFGSREMEDFYSQTSLSIRAELTEAQADVKQRQVREVLTQEQCMLLLNWALEEKYLEMSTLESEMDRFSGKFESILGVENEEWSLFEFPGPVGTKAFSQDMESIWNRLLAAFLAFLPRGSCLHVNDPDVLQWFKEKGVVFTPLEKGDSLPCLVPPGLDSALWGSVSGRTVFREQSVSRRPWLDGDHVVISTGC